MAQTVLMLSARVFFLFLSCALPPSISRNKYRD
jgi:hypothetical protein